MATTGEDCSTEASSSRLATRSSTETDPNLLPICPPKCLMLQRGGSRGVAANVAPTHSHFLTSNFWKPVVGGLHTSKTTVLSIRNYALPTVICTIVLFYSFVPTRFEKQTNFVQLERRGTRLI